MYVYIYIYISLSIYIYIKREREREISSRLSIETSRILNRTKTTVIKIPELCFEGLADT